MKRDSVVLLVAGVFFALAGALPASDLDEFKVKREEVFEFAQKPAVTRNGDSITVAFESKGLCDVTVAIEDVGGKIIRHLASGVLGPNAPAPFQKDSKKQAIVWDGKDDQGAYVDNKDAYTVRVSLGLKPRFERTLFWSPKKRIAPGHRPLFVSAAEGVYVHEGAGVDHIRLFDHEGNYVRTVHPFPPDYTSAEAKSDSPKALQAALAKVVGLKWIEFPQDGKLYPEWQGIMYSTLLTSGNNAGTGTGRINPTKYGTAASAMALLPGAGAGKPGHLALAKRFLNRVATDGTTDGMPLGGPKTTVPVPGEKGPVDGAPRSAAFSPDGKWVYLTGYSGAGLHWIPGVVRLEYLGNKEPELFAGSLNVNEEGTDNQHFRAPMSVACDSQGRVYVADCMNNRIQVYDAAGKFVKTLAPVTMPVNIFVHPKTGHIYSASWLRVTRHHTMNDRVKATLTHYGPLEDFKAIATYPLEFASYSESVGGRVTGAQHDVFVDCQVDPPVVWVVPGRGDTDEKLLMLRRSYSKGQWSSSAWSACHYRLYVEKDGKLAEKANFARDAAQAVTRIDPPSTPAHGRQRLYVHPRTGLLYVAESDGSGVGKAFKELVVIDPATGKTRLKKLPFTTEDMDFDLNGLLYLRTDLMVARFEPESMREVPWDYGEEIRVPGFDGDGARLTAAVPMPGTGRPGCFHLGGFGVSPNGSIVVSCYNIRKLDVMIPGAFSARFQEGRPYMPSLYPGRTRWAEVHVWDKHGKLIHEDAVPGLGLTDGLAMDKDDNIYVVAAARRQFDGQDLLKPVYTSETLMKFKPGKARILSLDKNNPVPLSRETAPKRPPDVAGAVGWGGSCWVEGAEWMYGGVARDGFMCTWAPSCSCWNSRAALDLFARSYATELGRSCVAVLDTNGNLIMRIGRYGNVDDGVPLVKDGGPANPRPVGGDEVALAAPAYVASHTDHRLFIADYGNYRILSVKLGYHAEEKTPLKDVPDAGAK